MDDERVFILDAYNKNIYPHDKKAEAGISCAIRLGSHIEDNEYLPLIEK